jgi:hypothetical protein
MWVVKWLTLLAFCTMVGAACFWAGRNADLMTQIVYVAAGLVVCGIFYASTLHRLFPKSGMGERVVEFLEKTVEARQVALLHHIEHEHQGDLQAIKNLRTKALAPPVQEENVLDMEEYLQKTNKEPVVGRGGFVRGGRP